MAAGESRSSTLSRYFRQPIASRRPPNEFSSVREDSTNLSEARSDSASSECDENSRNVVRWLQSLPADNQWCEAEEQIGRCDVSGTLVGGISPIGDSDVPIPLKFQPPSRVELPAPKKSSKDKKYRRGALHATSLSNDVAKVAKKNIAKREKNGGTKKLMKKPIVSGKIGNRVEDGDDRGPEASNAARFTDCRPVFDNPEFEKMLDEAMSRAVNKYKRNERTWETRLNGEMSAKADQPTAKRSKPPNF